MPKSSSWGERDLSAVWDMPIDQLEALTDEQWDALTPLIDLGNNYAPDPLAKNDDKKRGTA